MIAMIIFFTTPSLNSPNTIKRLINNLVLHADNFEFIFQFF